ncbi:unnamed protein product [Cuscuta epithymum]|uniref:Strictosidine synthase conserved region domain-containing protein n=1 Tax=Cuscuta epithymum TaxID=186058 RepID=A0AAV0CR43_9ASTE|nr:unnamed protein product [Cuscuta epithymum]
MALNTFFIFMILFAGGLSFPVPSDHYYQINLPNGIVGPESIAFDCNGRGPYVGVSDGRILRWEESIRDWTEFAVMTHNRNRQLCDGITDTRREPFCGRPLGLKFHPKTCELYITDAYFGLMKVGPNGGIATQLANSAQGHPFMFLNDLDINPINGAVYFTDSSIRYQRRDYSKIISTGDSTGRLLRFDPNTKQVRVLHDGLAFPNGIVLSRDNSYLLVVESQKNQILKFPLSNNRTRTPSVFARVDRFADNIRRNGEGDYWVALNTAREGYTEPVGLKFDENGRLIQVVNGDIGNTLEFVSHVEQHNGRMWFGSPRQSYVGTIIRV